MVMRKHVFKVVTVLSVLMIKFVLTVVMMPTVLKLVESGTPNATIKSARADGYLKFQLKKTVMS